ncbi:fungal-specific transcription factor domain-containing protein [Cladorrhinum samala]|uniref:Fungal-specific transcription factor domain-containing protein n=1 Tax=Cladorrhinum samala TaxID=585594 RepID=A0AAV9HPX1_9PEZI|nr:fungal-specific transcription factor domain-containing protein [Cladorrhinum samala]
MASSSTGSPQVSGPPSTIAYGGIHKPPRILACVLCQHRKIKCDRNFPCANCTKANVKCTPSTPAPARKRRRPNQDLQERLARCEELLKEYANEKPEGPVTPRASHSSIHEDSYNKWQPTPKLIKEDGGMRFMDNPLLGTVYDELRAMREIVDSEGNDDCSSDALTPDDNSDLILGGDSPNVNVQNLWPSAPHVIRLWQVYLDRVNPLTKVIHVPSLQPYLAEAVNGPQTLPKNVEALLFSIFVMAAVSLTPEECHGILGYSRAEALHRYSTGVRLCLIRMGFLKSHDLVTLQAIVIYLISLQGRYNRHAAWILNGVVIRIAQKMGLHRDGEFLGLSPFEAEMRRRLWWAIIMVDSKYALYSGLSHSFLPRGWDTKAPKNLNDADIFPSATEPFQDREGPTEMIFCIFINKFGQFLVETPGFEVLALLEEQGNPASAKIPEEQLNECKQHVEKLAKDLLEILDKYCDPMAGPVHQMAITIREHIVRKFKELLEPPKHQQEWSGEVQTHKDNTFKVAVCALEHNEANYISTRDKGFMWFSLLNFQLDVFVYVAGQLCHRTEGTLVDRAWKQVDVVYTFHPELFETTSKVHAALAVFILKAWRKREETLLTRTGQIPDTPFYIDKLRASFPDDQYKSEPTPPDPYTPASLATGFQPAIQDGTLDGYLGYLDWDMFDANVMPSGGQSSASFGGFGIGGLGPSVEW